MFQVQTTGDDYTPIRLTIHENGGPRRTIELTPGQAEHLRAELKRMLEQHQAIQQSRCLPRIRRGRTERLPDRGEIGGICTGR